MTRLTYTKTTTKKIERDVPDYYGYDDTPLGKVVDFLLKDDTYHGRTVRDRMCGDLEGVTVENCIDKLERAYAQAREIVTILGVIKS